MSPIDTSHLTRYGGGEEIPVDRECAHCGYNLRGLRTTDVCPECGNPASFLDAPAYPTRIKPGKVLRDSGRMLDAPRAYLRFIAMSFRLIAVGGLLMLGASIGLFYRPEAALGAVAVFGSVCWTIGAVGVCASRRLGRVRHPINTTKEWPIERALTVATQPLWMLSFGCVLAMLIIDDPAGPLRVGAVCSAIVAAVGAGALFMQLTNLSYWAGDSPLAFRLGKNLWWLALAILLSLPLAIGGGLGAFPLWTHPGDYPLLWVLVACAGGAVTISLYTLVTLLSVWRLGGLVSGDLRATAQVEIRRMTRLSADSTVSAPAAFEIERTATERSDKPLNPYEIADD